ncbi:hypothetical protein XELAEV_18020210mg [Xenopus laevis]|uniref:Uncharacterized protein n=1 Tax=Xenopus laevis TaxID=8355 RepID=A0A974HQH1_XENLA|nr:hypothetical protein XELAEV_18020210mg [Xenopus laevis]
MKIQLVKRLLPNFCPRINLPPRLAPPTGPRRFVHVSETTPKISIGGGGGLAAQHCCLTPLHNGEKSESNQTGFPSKCITNVWVLFKAF